METLGYYNGVFGNLEKMTIPMRDRVCWFGDGVYDATYSRNFKIFALDEHVDRFFRSMEKTEIKPSFGKEQLKFLLNDLVKQVDQGNNFVYWQATRGSGAREHVYSEDMSANLWVTITPKALKDMTQPYRLISLPDERREMCDVKAVNLLPAVLAAQRTKRAGCDECVLYRTLPQERVTECAHSNICYLQDGTLVVPPTDRYILKGVARDHLIEVCKQMGVNVVEKIFDRAELKAADEIVVTSSGALCMRVDRLDGDPVGGKDGALLVKLQDALLAQFEAVCGR